MSETYTAASIQILDAEQIARIAQEGPKNAPQAILLVKPYQRRTPSPASPWRRSRSVLSVSPDWRLP